MHPLNSKINKSVFLIGKPLNWAFRYGSSPSATAPLFIEIRDNDARLLDINGEPDPDWHPKEWFDFEEDDKPMHVAEDAWERAVNFFYENNETAAFCEIVGFGASINENWEEFRLAAAQDRFTSSAWFERDRKNLILTDGLTAKELVILWDDDVDGAIESGYLKTPRGPRPLDSDWLEPLLAYARETGAITPQMELTERPSCVKEQERIAEKIYAPAE